MGARRVRLRGVGGKGVGGEEGGRGVWRHGRREWGARCGRRAGHERGSGVAWLVCKELGRLRMGVWRELAIAWCPGTQ